MLKNTTSSSDAAVFDPELNEPLLQVEKEGKEKSVLNHQCLKAIFFQILASLSTFFSGLMLKIGTSSTGTSDSQFLFMRGVMTLLFSMYILKRDRLDLGKLYTYRATLSLRMAFGVIANKFCNMGIMYLNLSMATTVFNINPLLGVVLGAIVLREKISRLQIIILLMTFAGVILLIKPCLFTLNCSAAAGNDSFNIYLLFPLIAAFARASAMVFLRKCKDIHWIFPTIALNFGFCLITPIIAGFSSTGFTQFTTQSLGFMALYGLFGISSNAFSAKALQSGEMGFSLPISYLSVILASLTDVFVFHVPIAWNQWVGAGIIMCGIIMVTYVKYHQAQKS